MYAFLFMFLFRNPHCSLLWVYFHLPYEKGEFRDPDGGEMHD